MYDTYVATYRTVYDNTYIGTGERESRWRSTAPFRKAYIPILQDSIVLSLISYDNGIFLGSEGEELTAAFVEQLQR